MKTILVAGCLLLAFGSSLLAADGDKKYFTGPSMFAPQICGGRTFSITARTSDWKVDSEARVCQAKVGKPLLAHVKARAGGNFNANLRLRMTNDARVRFFLGDYLFELTNGGQTVEIETGKKKAIRKEVARQKTQLWSDLRITRIKETLKVKLNGKEVAVLNDQARAYDRIGVDPLKGDIQVNHFMVSGHLVVRSEFTKPRVLVD